MNLRSQQTGWMWVLVTAAVLGVSSGAFWPGTVTGEIRLKEQVLAPDDTVELAIDQAYYANGGAQLPGVLPGAPLPAEVAVPEDGPRANPGFISVLVYTDPTLGARAVQRERVRAFAAERGAYVKYEYDAVLPGVLNLRDLPVSEVAALERVPGVIRVEKDEYHPNVLLLHDSMPLIRGLQSQITGAGYSADGSGVRICVCDTGIDSDHIMYSDRIDTAKGYDFYNDDSNPEDDNGHGSHCSGIAAGGTGLSWDPCGTGSMPFQGVAPEATLIGVKILNSAGGGYDSDIIAGINYCGDQSASGAQADVISLSIGTGNYSGPCSHSWAVAANNAVANGVVVVAASGNSNYSNAMNSPACGVDVIAVGMTWKNDYPTCEDPTTNWNWGICTDYAPQTDEVGCFSNESDYLDVTAPGANIWSASNAAGGGSITGMSGTSMSCPHVAGLAALVLGMDGSLTPAEVRQIIRDGAIDMGPTGFDRAYGHGRIDVLDTLALVNGGPTCSDGIQNQGEDRIDCGGPCPPCECTSDPVCDDGAYCNGAETCDAYGDCQPGTAPNCNDGVGCTDDSCNEGTDSCDNVANDANCDNGLYCDGEEWCHATADCQSGTAPNCNDGVGCTDDSCNEGTDSCDNVPNDANCDNGLYCDGAESCHATLDCQSGTAPNCNDGVGCTDDSCNEGTDACDNVANDGNCDNGLYCDGEEWCHATADCQSGTTPNCNDGVGCTDDSCNEGTDSCDNVANDTNCDNGLYCDGAETCHATLDCQAGSDPCPGQLCDEGTDTCYDCQDNADCADGLYCNGEEQCVGGTCEPGTAVDCDDSVGCTDDSCNEGTDSCDNVANDANCDNGLYCDGAETCHATLDCQAGTAVDCNDGVGCTDDSCNEGTDSCDNVPNDAYCDNGLYCDGAETCHATLDCQAGTAVDCNDGVGCTDDSCNEGTDSCDNVANDANCPDDGLYCNGTEFCDAVNDCDHTGDPCAPEFCNEATDTCEAAECQVDEDCDDGSDCTVDTCVDGVCYNECPIEISSFPYTEGFESGWGDWANVAGDDMDWTRRSGSTPSSSTGPSGAHGGSYYVYTESSSPNYPSKTAILEGPCFDLTTSADADLTFWYHMYGTAMGTLNLEASEDCVSWTTVWSLSGNQGNAWYQANVDLSAYALTKIKMRFRGVTGSSYTSDMAVDDLSMTVTPAIICDGDEDCDDGLFCNGAETCVGGICQAGTNPCPLQGCDEVNDVCGPCTGDEDCDDGSDCTVDTCAGGVCYNDCPNTVSSYPYSEGFESGFGAWVNVSGDDMDWTRRSGSTPSSSTGPSGAHGGSYYVYTESSSPNYPNKTAILEGPCFDLDGASDAGLTFWYHMYGTGMGTLYVEVSDDCVSWTEVWSLSGNQGNAWYQANVDLTAYAGATTVIRFRGVTGGSYTSDMSVDDISITATLGPECTVPADCDDGLYCNGAEDCVDGTCVDGTPVTCSDGVGCTDDSCNEGTDSCDYVPNDANCDNGLYCDGAETCHATLDCQAGVAVDCDDGVDCTDDSCNEGTDSCDNVPDDAYCDNGVYCDGAETCHATLDCQAGTAVDCDDGVGCTDDSCNEGTDSCDNTPNDAYCPDDGLFCNGTEYCDAVSDCSSTGDPCEPGEVCNEDTDTCDPGGGAQMEAGSLTVGGSPVTVDLTNAYASPVVVCAIEYYNNTTPVVARVTDVTATSFDVYLQNPSGGGVSAETVSFVVVEEGTWTIDGVKVEAQVYLSTVTDQNNSWVGEVQTYGQSYTNPVVIGQVMSDDDPAWSVFWCQGSARGNPPSATVLRTGKTVCEDTDTSRADETIGFIVFEAGHGTIGGVAFEALVGADTVQGVVNSPPYPYTFSTAFASAPTVAVVALAGMDGGNGGWAYTYGPTTATSTTLYLAADEDQVGDSERNHTTEQVGYVVFESAFVYP